MKSFYSLFVATFPSVLCVLQFKTSEGIYRIAGTVNFSSVDCVLFGNV